MNGKRNNYFHNEKLLQLQKEYLETKSIESWQALFLLSFEVCRNIVVSEFIKTKRKFNQDDLYDYALNACIYVLRRYKSIGYKHGKAAPKNYCVNQNFIAVLKGGVRHALYYSTTETKMFDRTVSLDCTSLNKINVQSVIKIL